jgi:hypothetical protein
MSEVICQFLPTRARTTTSSTMKPLITWLSLLVLFLGFGLAHAISGTSSRSCAWMDTTLPPPKRAALLLSEMELDEKLWFLYGHPSNYTGAIPGNTRLGIPPLYFNDGPQGVQRGANGSSTSWPSTLSMAATFDDNATGTWGILMGQEFFLKGVNVQLGPGANFARYPGNGRMFEVRHDHSILRVCLLYTFTCNSCVCCAACTQYIAAEDPFLGAKLIAPLVRGIQSQHVIATVKHFINNNQDYHRYDIDEVVDERTQMEIYYPTFMGAVAADVGAAMCGYNKINGLHACEQPSTLLQFKSLGFSGCDCVSVCRFMFARTFACDGVRVCVSVFEHVWASHDIHCTDVCSNDMDNADVTHFPEMFSKQQMDDERLGRNALHVNQRRVGSGRLFGLSNLLFLDTDHAQVP